jgi:hypothetical protein
MALRLARVVPALIGTTDGLAAGGGVGRPVRVLIAADVVDTGGHVVAATNDNGESSAGASAHHFAAVAAEPMKSEARGRIGAVPAAVCITIAGCIAITGCTTTVGGTAEPADQIGPTAAGPTTTPVPVPAPAINGKLLTRNELASIVADTGMRELDNYTTPGDQVAGIDPQECAERITVAATLTYHDDARAAMAGNTNVGDRGQLAAQVITVWQARKDATRVVPMSATEWRFCRDNQPFTVTTDGGTQHWLPGPVTVHATRMSSTTQRQEPPPRTCSHVMAAQANIVVESMVCGDGDSVGQADQIADRLLTKFPQ